jgi:repressor LexA
MIDSIRPALTARQQQAYDLICESIRVRRRSPSIQEIADAMGIRSKNGVTNHMAALESKGYIEREPFIARGIRVCDHAVYRRPYSIPIVGRVQAGPPAEAYELLEWLSLADILGDDIGLNAVKIEGNGMADQQVQDGDYLIRRGTRNILLWRPMRL